MIDFTVARDKLAQFETADEIANYLYSEGVKGFRSLALQCPIANWMREQTQEYVYVCDYEMWETSNSAYNTANNANSAPRNTVAMEEFIQKFDKGHYPHLVGTWTERENRIYTGSLDKLDQFYKWNRITWNRKEVPSDI